MPSPRPFFRSARARLVALITVGLLAMGAVTAWWVGHHGSARGPRPVAPRVNVLLVSIDTLRADRTGGRLTPSLNAVAARGSRFLDARSPVPLTLPAHTSLLTGLLPPHHGVRMNGVHRLAPGVPTLATLLQAVGYHTAAFVGAYVLDPRFGLAAGFETYDAEIPRRDAIAGELEAERRGEVVADRAIAWLNAQPADAPFFLWVHLYDPHAPYDPPAPWLERASGQPYDGEVAYADAQVGRLVDALGRRGLVDRTLIIVTGDHGESLGDHGEPTHGLLVYEKALDVPLVLAGPGVPRAERRDAASLVDVAPTTIRLVGLSPPRSLDGRDLLAARPAGFEAETYIETEYPAAAGFAPLRGIVTGRWKFIGGSEPAELYDLDADPREEHDVSASHASVVAAMARRASGIAGNAVAPASAPPSAEAAERLRALGYVASAPTTPDAGAKAPSPRQLVAVWPRFQAAIAEMAAGHHERAVPALAQLAHDFPDSALFQSSFGRALDEAGRAREALAVFRAAAARWPTNTTLLQGLATAARNAGLGDEALNAERAVLAIDPTDAAAENGIGLLLSDRGRSAEARDAFRRAIALDPHVVSYWVNLGNACRAAGQPREADDAYRRALALDETSADAMNGIGVLLVQADRPAAAANWFERAVARAPDFYEAWLNLGIARQERGDGTGAAEAYRRVLAAPPAFRREKDSARQLLASLPGR